MAIANGKQRLCHTTRLPKTMCDKLGQAFYSTIKAVIGVDDHATKIAVQKEVGWTDLRVELAHKKVSMLQVILKQKRGGLQRKILQHTYAGAAYDDNGRVRLRHTRITGSKSPKSS